MITVIILSLVFLIALVFLSPSVKEDRVLYQDKGLRSKVFTNKKFGIAAKPDLILRTQEGDVVVEYKGRIRGIYQSDIAEAKAAALASRSKYKIVAIQIKTQTESQVFYLPKDDNALYSEIKDYIEMARVAETNHLPASPQKFKCKGFPVNQSCSESAA